MVKALSKIVSAAAAALFVASASAAPFTISAALTGDPRLGTPYLDLLIKVRIDGDTTSNVVNWLVDIASQAHPDAKLDELYFNMFGSASLYGFSGFLPVGWAVDTLASTQGGGKITPTFLFEALDPNGPLKGDDKVKTPKANTPKTLDVTNTQNLSFVMTKSAGFFTAADFLNAATSCSNAVEPLGALGCGQLGAHLQGLQQGASGFLLGNFVDDTRPPEEVPEPASVALVGLGLLALVASRRRKA